LLFLFFWKIKLNKYWFIIVGTFYIIKLSSITNNALRIKNISNFTVPINYFTSSVGLIVLEGFDPLKCKPKKKKKKNEKNVEKKI